MFLGSQAELGDMLAPVSDVAGATVKISSTSWAVRYQKINSGPRQNALPGSHPVVGLPQALVRALDTVGEFMSKAPADACNFWSLAWGGKAKIPPAGGTAFFHRDPLFYAEPGAG